MPNASEVFKLKVDDNCDDSHALIACQFSFYLEEEYSSVCKTEVNKYLGDYWEGVKDVKFDILAWWKANSSKYPVLSQLTRDLLTMPVLLLLLSLLLAREEEYLTPYVVICLPWYMVEVLICVQN